MTLSKFVGVMTGGLVLAGMAKAQDYQAEIAQLRAELKSQSRDNAQLRTELADLKSQNGDKWLTEERAAEIKGLVKDVLADAETRTSLQQNAATSGYDNGFFIGSADGNFKLRINALEQIRWTYNNMNADQVGGFDETDANTQWGFENRRTQLTFSGNVVDPSFTYMARFNYGSTSDPYTPEADSADDPTPEYDQSPGMILQDAWFNKDFGSGLGVKVGQFKTPFMAESLRNDGDQLTAERSTIDYIFSAGYQQGIMATYSADMFRVMGSYANGPRGQNNNFTTGTTSFNLAVRGEVKLMGNWNEFASESATKSDETGLMVGAAFMYWNNRGQANNPYEPAVENVAYQNAGATDSNIYWTVDTTFKWSGLSVMAAFVGNNFDTVNLDGENQNQYGFVAQAGYRVTDAIEVFGRYEWYDILDASALGYNTTQKDINNILAFGVNVYAMSNVKWTTQVGISLGNMSGITDNQSENAMTGAGWRNNQGTPGDDETQVNVISQLQVSF
jgi:regulator of replication initiation timing